MLPKLLLLVFLSLGMGLGMGAAVLLRPAAGVQQGSTAEPKAKASNPKSEYVKLNNQFVVPVIESEDISALMVLSLSLETAPGMREQVYAREPKLRDAFLRALFDHANIGGFQGVFTKPETLDPLRTALREIAQNELGEEILDVLIVDIARQDT